MRHEMDMKRQMIPPSLANTNSWYEKQHRELRDVAVFCTLQMTTLGGSLIVAHQVVFSDEDAQRRQGALAAAAALAAAELDATA